MQHYTYMYIVKGSQCGRHTSVQRYRNKNTNLHRYKCQITSLLSQMPMYVGHNKDRAVEKPGNWDNTSLWFI